MDIHIYRASYDLVQPFRKTFLEESAFQFILDKAYIYGWADVYAFYLEGKMIGYGSVWGKRKREDRDTIFEFYVDADHRRHSDLIFRQWVKITGAVFIEAQTNDTHLCSLLLRYAAGVKAEAILFRDRHTTNIQIPGTHFLREAAREIRGADEGGFIVVHHGEVVANGGLMLNYNLPYADVYMTVNEKFRGQGFGSYIVQELKKHAYSIGRVPAARCDISNALSHHTLLKAGYEVCGYRLNGQLSQALERHSL